MTISGIWIKPELYKQIKTEKWQLKPSVPLIGAGGFFAFWIFLKNFCVEVGFYPLPFLYLWRGNFPSNRKRPFHWTLTTEYHFFKYVTCVSRNAKLPQRYATTSLLWVSANSVCEYWIAPNMATTCTSDNDTSLRSWQRTRQRWDSYEPDSSQALEELPI